MSRVTSGGMARRQFLRLGVMGAGVTLVAACQPKADEVAKVVKEVVKETVIVQGEEKVVEKEVTKVVEKQVVVAPTAKPTVTLRVQTPDWGTLTIFSQLAPEFTERNPGIEIKQEPVPGGAEGLIKKITMEFAAGMEADCFWLNIWNAQPQMFAYYGLTRPVDDRIDAEKYPIEEFYPAALEAGRYEGKLGGLPHFGNFGPSAICWNKDMFLQAGVAEPTPDWTMDDYLQAAQKLTVDKDKDGKPDIYGTGLRTGYHACTTNLTGWGGPVKFGADGRTCNLDDKSFRAAMQFWVSCAHEYNVAPKPGVENISIANGNLAMGLFHTGSVLAWMPIIKNKFRYEMALGPKGPTGTRGGSLCADFVMMGGQTKNQDEVWQAIKFYCSEDVGIRRTLMGSGDPGARPACWSSATILNQVPQWKAEFADFFATAPHEGSIWNFRALEFVDAYNAGIQDIMLQKVTVDEGIDKMMVELNEVLAMPRLAKL